ncbi:MAG: hypothetical protein FWF05_04610 [Oscillospiraceae bacterium]|nr:hypothetical protein [Oscillospiraceae bacterium]
MDLLGVLNEFMIHLGVDYAVCGGYAIDLFLGQKTRPHKDLDVAVYREDRDAIVQRMLNDGWDMYEPCGCAFLHKIGGVETQKRIKSNIWCVRPDNAHYKFTAHEKDMFAVEFDGSEQTDLDFIELLFNDRRDGEFLYAKNKDIKMKLDSAVIKVKEIPYLTPELVLLYKSTMSESPDYQLDFENASMKMNEEQRAWLNGALIRMFPRGHKWIK